jgi:divalent metal cation (Fe/Co/Zn/Cd) transporter
MTLELPFLIALTITVIASLFAVLYLHRSLHRVLVELCGNEHRASFWTAYSNFVLVLVPIVALLVARSSERPADSGVFTVADLLRWSLFGLVVSAFVIAMGVATFIWPGRTPISVSAADADDLRRLLTRVEEIRARDVLTRPAE